MVEEKSSSRREQFLNVYLPIAQDSEFEFLNTKL